MLLNGFNHVALITNDTDRLVSFYGEVFDAKVDGLQQENEHVRLTFIRVGESAELNVFEVVGNTEADRQTPMFGRGRIDHLGLQADSMEAFEEIGKRLMAAERHQLVTDFGSVLSHVLPGS